VALPVFVLGAGRAGKALAAALAANGANVVGLHGRRSSQDAFMPVSSGALPESIALAEVVLVTVRDAQITAAIDELLSASLKPGATVLHASGSADPSGVAKLRARGHPAGTFHPLVPLTSVAAHAQLLVDTWIGVDGDRRARETGSELAALLGAHVMPIPDGEKGAYHAAAVLASNFPCVLAYLARQLLARSGVPADQASAAVVSLMHASVENLRGRDPAVALTGPVVRGDVDTVKAHLRALDGGGDEVTKRVYTSLTSVAVEMVRQENADSGALREIEHAVQSR
jgi:predicted short-subunit dehydrogenase-like oxidoreductase (DUF2520 family)